MTNKMDEQKQHATVSFPNKYILFREQKLGARVFAEFMKKSIRERRR
jgi:hypothetical protein